MNQIVSKNDLAQNGSQLIAEMDRTELRSLFYLFAGKPDSKTKVFSEPIHITSTDIVELNSCITRKLETHNVDATITTVRVGYSDNEQNEFSTWQEFQDHHWQEPQEVEEIVVKWDFLVKINEYKTPQRHTLMFRLSEALKPNQVLQMMMSGDTEDLEAIDLAASSAFCRVDFINSQISKELINEVSAWYSARKAPKLIPDVWYWCKKRRHRIAMVFDHWFTFSWVLLLSSLALYTNNLSVNNVTIAVGLFIAIYSLRPISRVAHFLASKIYDALARIEGSKVVFEFTSGDKKAISGLEASNKKQGRKFMLISGWNILLNLCAAVLYTYLFNSSGAI